jgi:hypothetical protein
VTTVQRLKQLLLDCNYEIRYAGYETLGIQNTFVTWLISELTHLMFMARLPQLVSLIFKGSADLKKCFVTQLRDCGTEDRLISFLRTEGNREGEA